MFRNVLDVGILIVYLAMLTVAVTHKGTGEVIDKIGHAFSSSIEVAKK